MELQLLGLVQAIERRGYPIKVSVIANETDTGGESAALEDPQAYAELVVRELELFFPVEAPVIIVTPNGFGVAGKQLKGGRPQRFPGGDGRSLLRGIAVPPLEADALARTAMLAVRQAAAAAGRPLPEHVPAAKALAPPPGAAAERRRRGRRHLGLVARSRQHPAAGLGALCALERQISAVRSHR